MLLIWLAIAWMAGIVAADMLAPGAGPLAAAALAGLAAAALGWRRPAARMAGLCLLLAALGAWRYQAAQVPTMPHSVWLLAGQKVALQGTIETDPKRTDDGQQVFLRVAAARAAGPARPAEGTVLLALPPYPEYHYGQRLLVTGDLKQPRAAERPGEFDYRAYLARKRVFVLMREPAVRVLPGEEGNPLLGALIRFRDRCKAVLLRELPEPQASIAVGILLGLQASIPADVYAAFSATGTSHILVVSGWNFTIVAAMLSGAAARLRLGKGVAFGFSLAAMWVYALFVGATPTVLRAATMASLVVLAGATERRSEAWTLLAAACWALSLFDPNTLWDLGFQLSALATASLFAFGKPTEALLQRCPPLRWTALAWATEALTATLAAQILALPIILYHFGNLSIVAPLANILLVPVVPYTMLLGTIALLGGLLALTLGQWLALAVWLPLAWLTEGARLLAQVPWAAVQLPPFPLWVLLSYYAIVAGGWLWSAREAGETEE